MFLLFRYVCAIVICVSWCNAIETNELKLEVVIEDGPVLGHLRKSYDNKTFIAFEGIPYATPPIGDLRFRSPQAPASWTETLHASKTYICTQFIPMQLLGTGVMGQEDCLYINVYVPGGGIDPQKKYDVIVHIHGGAFILGAPKMMAGPKYIMNHDVVYVNFNYRLGIFGFLSTSDQWAPGNYGLKDQNLALQWIKHNIAHFGGNPDSVTLTGHSAGSASVHYHVLSEKSKGLFNKAVMISGTALNPWALTENPIQKAEKLASIFNCSTIANQDLVACLRQVQAADLGLAMKQFFKFGNVLPITPFGPVVETPSADAFISKTPYHLLSTGQLGSNVPMIFSCVEDEGIFPSGYFALIGRIDKIKSNWYEVMQYGLDLQDTVASNEWSGALQKIREYYFPDDDLSKNNVANLTKLFSDRLYLVPLQKAVQLHLKITDREPLYFYYFNYDSPGFRIFPSVKGVAHSEDLQLMFNLIITPGELTEEDHNMSGFLTQMLVNFARSSVPMEEWTPMSGTGPWDYYYITQSSGNKMAVRENIAPEEFWDELPIKEFD